MPAYVIAKVSVTDRGRYREYAKLTPGVIAKFGGRFLARGGEVVTLEGPQETQRVALIEFPSLAKAKEFYNSAEYREVKKLREGAATVSLIAVAGE
jgi:uncharacterized protein (DUF1330 family)